MYNSEHADRVWSFEAKKNAREIIITGTGNNPELYEQSATGNLNFLRENSLVNENFTTLHIGCGNGRIEKYLSKEVRHCYGADVSSKMVELAYERCADSDNVTFEKNEGCDLPFLNDNSLDVAYSFFCFQHMPRECVKGYMKELNRVLKQGGKFLCQFQLYEERAIIENYQDPDRDHPSDIRLYSIEQIESLANEYGFYIEKWVNRVEAELDGKRRVYDCNIFPIFVKI